MCYITKSMTIVITLWYVTVCAKPNEYYYNTLTTRKVYLKRQGHIQGSMVQLRNYTLPPVEVYRGIPYAAPPVGDFRFMPPSSTFSSWANVRYMKDFGPVCPQKFPDESIMTTKRRNYVNRLKPFLLHEDEDCLYLNIYAPFQDPRKKPRSYPVIVFLHDDSFEWSSGNPYDGSVLASYGQVIVVTLNFRLGILGFLKVEAGETTPQSNFGLVDQVAALIWIKDNIEAFGGDPYKVTLMGHGTGAVFASLLTISPMATFGQEDLLFHRAILMSGTALADWALVQKPLDVSIQVAQALNCQLTDNFAACLRRKGLRELKAAVPEPEPYKTTFGPTVDNLIVPSDPKKSMVQYTNIFRRFELMYGVTELESLHLPLGGDAALIQGMFENERDEELMKYMRTRCEKKPEACVAKTKARYNYDKRSFQRDQSWMGRQPDIATLARDELLDILSDARTVAPLVQTGLYHSALNLQSYFYVFTHKTHSQDYTPNKTHTGEELPYVFGVPIEGPKFHFEDVPYTEDEKRLSMTMMQYFCNFAYTGNPEMPKPDFINQRDYKSWHPFDKEWFQFDRTDQNYIRLDIPISNGQFYRINQTDFWNKKLFQNQLPFNIYNLPDEPDSEAELEQNSFNRPPFTEGVIHMYGNKTNKYRTPEDYGNIQWYPDIVTSAPEEVRQSSSTSNIIILLGVLFLMANIVIFTLFYFKCVKNKKVSPSSTIQRSPVEESAAEEDKGGLLDSCRLIRMLRRSKEDDTYDSVQLDSKGPSKLPLTRALSNSTIDAHVKVREWIATEIVSKYSPKQEKKPNKKKSGNSKSKHPEIDNCPTRPVSPADESLRSVKPLLLIKTASIDRSKRRKRSVAIDATPSGRGPSVLMQQPIELTKSLDYSHCKNSPIPLRRSVTLEDFTSANCRQSDQDIRKSCTSIDLNKIETEPTYIRIDHSHSKSDPVQDVDYNAMKRLKTFNPNADVNVTSRDENMEVPPPMTPEEALMTIKRRNFPKVLPDHPGRQAFLNKRRSMPVHTLHVIESQQYSNSEPYSPTARNFLRFPPVPPPRTCTLDRQGSNPQPVCLSEPMLAEEPASSPEPEVSCNNLYVGPLIPRTSKDKLDSIKENKGIPRAIVTTNPKNPIKRPDPKVVVKPTINRHKVEGNKQIPRVVVPDNKPDVKAPSFAEKKTDEEKSASLKKSQIPTLVKTSNSSLHKEPSSSESTSPSSGDSDTGTVVKRV